MKADGVDLLTYASFVRLLGEGGPDRRLQTAVIPGRSGQHADIRPYYDAANFDLEIGLRGTEGFTNLSAITRLLGKPFGLVTLERDTPNAGTIEALVQLASRPQPSQNEFTYIFPMYCPAGVWRTKAVSTATGTAPTVVTSGDRPIHDMVITLSAPGTASYTDTGGKLHTLTIDAAAGAGIYVIDVGARTVKKSGVAQDRYLTVGSEEWMIFEPDTTIGITGTVSITVDWHDKWAAG